MVMGRPTDYKPEFCELAIEYLRKGKSRTQLCSKLDIAKSTLQLWEKIHSDFSAAIERGLAHSEAKWELRGERNLKNNKYNTKMYELQVRNRFGWNTNQSHNIVISEGKEKSDIDNARKQYEKPI